MTLMETPKAASPPPDRPELVPEYYDTDLIVTPEGNPSYTPAMLTGLLESMSVFGQQIPGFISPSPELPPGKFFCDEGNRRLEVCRLLGIRLWAFNAGRFVSAAERIRLKFHHHASRRRMSRDEIAEEAGRYIELTGKTQGEAAKLLGISDATLSRAFGEQKILPSLRERVALLGCNVRTLIASTPPELMERVVEFAATPCDDKLPTHNQVAAWVAQEKKKASPGKGRKAAKPKTITLKLNGRAVTFSVGDKDTAVTVAEDLRLIVAKLGRKDIAETVPDGWPFHFS